MKIGILASGVISAALVGTGMAYASDCGTGRVFSRVQHSCYRSFNKELATMRRFADAGMVTRCFTVGNTENAAGNMYSEYPPVWKGRDRYDWELLDREFQEVVDASPAAKFLVLVDLNTPSWLRRRLRYDSFSLISAAATDARWRKETKTYLKAFVDHVEKTWGERTVGYVLGAGNCTEWTEYDFYDGDSLMHVFSAPWMDEAWVEWCRLRGVSHGKAVPHGGALDSAAFHGTLYDPATEGEKIDYWKFRNECVADALLDLAHEAKCLAPSKEIGAFFGYYLLCNPHCVVSWSHLDYLRVFDSPDIDFVITPANYHGRACGGGTGTLLVQGSLAMRGKRLFHEIDLWPHTRRPANNVFDARYFKTEADDIAGNTREAAFAMVTHASLWWFDQWGGFYDSPALFDRISTLERLRMRYANDESPSCADVLFVADPESAYGVNEKSAELEHFPWGLRDELSRTGFAVDFYSFDDLPKLDMSRYRVVFFPGTFLVTPDRERLLHEKVCRDGRTVVWYYAPGISDGKTIDVGRVRKWTGADFGCSDVSTVQMDGWRSVYVPNYKPETFDTAAMARVLLETGAHSWSDAPVVVHANRRLLSVHLRDGRDRTIRLPRRVLKVVELISGATVATNADSFVYRFESPDTRIFEMVD